MGVTGLTCSAFGTGWRAHPARGPPAGAQPHRRSPRSPAPACTAAQHCQTSSTARRPQQAGGGTVPPSGGLDPAQSLESPESAAGEPRPATRKLRYDGSSRTLYTTVISSCNRKHTLNSAPLASLLLEQALNVLT